MRIVKCMLHISREEQKRAAARARRRSDQALEVQPAGPRGPRAVGRLHGRLRRRARALQHRRGAMARRARRPQVVPQLGDHANSCASSSRSSVCAGPSRPSTSSKSGSGCSRFPRVRERGSGCRRGPGARVPDREAAHDPGRLSPQPQLAARGVQPVHEPRPGGAVRRGHHPRCAAPAGAAALDALRQRRAGGEVPPPARRDAGAERRPAGAARRADAARAADAG